VYPNAPLGKWVRAHLAEARPHLYGRLTPDFVAPLVFCRPASPRALFARVEAALAGCRGQIRPLNAEATGDAAVERWVNQAVLRAEADPDGAVRAARAALKRAPAHPEALRQLALLLANHRGDAAGALDALRRLHGVVSGERADEVARAIGQLEAACR
jgi:hypothetical protein